jgi:hypothetical protein
MAVDEEERLRLVAAAAVADPATSERALRAALGAVLALDVEWPLASPSLPTGRDLAVFGAGQRTALTAMIEVVAATLAG